MYFEVKKNPNPWNRANIVSKACLWWLIPLLFRGKTGNLQAKDIYDCPDDDRSEKLGKLLQKEWTKELAKLRKRQQPSLLKALIRSFGWFFALNSLLAFVNSCFIEVMQPILLGYLIQQFAQIRLFPNRYLYLYAMGICLLSICNVFIHHPCFFRAGWLGMKVRIACSTLVYKKALRLSQTALGSTTVGHMVNLISNDVNCFENIMHAFPFLVIGPLHVIIVVCILWQYIDYACLAGVSILILYMPVQSFMGKLCLKLRDQTALLTDERIQLMDGIINGIRVIKMYTWEFPFAKLVNEVRRKEVRKIWHSTSVKSLDLASTFVSSKVIVFISFVVYVIILKGELTPEKAFISMCLFNSFRCSMALYFPRAITKGAECIVSLRRLQNFLLLEEQEKHPHLNETDFRPGISHCGVWLENIVASWKMQTELTLHCITLSVRPGDLLAVIGPVGCGKSSLLMTVLGELPLRSGEVKIRGKIAYASQEPWVFGSTLKQNILFGSPYDKDRYRKVIDVCALDEDIKALPYGDETPIGEKGTTLSGGQKSRINLARAIYSNADIYLLDDPLSAVDADVSKHLFEKCINGYLKEKVRILVTHQIQYLKSATQILLLKNGQCIGLGTYEQLMNSGIGFGSMIEDFKKQQKLASVVTNDDSVTMNALKPAYQSSLRCSVNKTDQVDENEVIEMEKTEKSPRIIEESKATGSVKFEVYKEYVRSGAGLFLFTVVVILSFVTQTLFVGVDYWLIAWTNDEQRHHNVRKCWTDFNEKAFKDRGLWNASYGILNHTALLRNATDIDEHCFHFTNNYSMGDKSNINSYFYLSIYSILIGVLFISSLARTLMFFAMCMKASISLHKKMMFSILQAPVSFFDNNPIGRILNRFSKDTGITDETLPFTVLDVVFVFGKMMSIIAIIAIIEVWLLVPAVVLTVLLILVRQYYMGFARDIKRYEGIHKSPVFSHLSTSVSGLPVIRAFKVQEKFELAFDHYQDKHSSMCFLFIAGNNWLGIVLDCLCVIYIISVTVVMVALAQDPSAAGKGGLAITSALLLSGMGQWGMRQTAEVESQMISVERILEFGRLEPEAELNCKSTKKLHPSWPSQGHISFENVSLQYSKDYPYVLKNLTFQIYSKEKIGIVGRTGAGKSSMIALLFRMAKHYGVLKIDGILTTDVGLQDLRKKISIIPQDPVLFKGSVRKNLDPFSEYLDEEIWNALDEAYLKDVVKSLSEGIDSEVSEGGSNFSVGQKQLLCFARAILRRNRILVLDEATANIDPNTDKLIQQTIKERFRHCTVLIIAHRLRTIMDCDRVLVLDAGCIKEFDKPFVLLNDQHSLFSHMVSMTGPVMAEQLTEIAYQTHLDRSEKEHSQEQRLFY